MPENSNTNEPSIFENKIEEMRHFFNVPVKITIQLDSCNMKVRDILQLQLNSIVELPKSAGENVDILANEQLIAFGEVLELEGCTGIRLTDFNTLT
jgi:flagellar motor switch protein FliN